MIPKIRRGSHSVGLVRYLLGRGSRNEHVDPHLVTGSPELVDLAAGRRLDARTDAGPIGQFLDEPQRQFGMRVTVLDRDQAGVVVGRRDAHVWHCPLSLHPDEPALSDERWAHICERFIEKLGFDGDDVPDRCRWAAIRHGKSAGGNDHIHLVVDLVTENGRKASVHNDRSRAQQACREIEQEFGLRSVEGRGRGAGERAYHPGELEADRDRGRPVGEPGSWAPENSSRRKLERVVRAVATASVSEDEFVHRLRGERVLVRARFVKGSREEVAGYSVALAPPEGEKPVWFPGGQLSRELTLPRLRAGTGWTAAQGPVLAWQPARVRRQLAVAAILPAEEAQRCVIELTALREQLRQVATDDDGAWAQIAGDTAAVFAAWSVRTEQRAGPLAAASRALARSAMTRTPPLPRTSVSRGPARRTARLLLTSGLSGLSSRALITQLANLSKAIHDMHQAQLEADRAGEIARAVRSQLPAAAAVAAATALRSTGVRPPGRGHDPGIER